MKNITILGSTGVVGNNALSVIQSYPDLFTVVALVANKNVTMLLKQCLAFSPIWVAMNDKKSAYLLQRELQDRQSKTHVLFGATAVSKLASLPQIDHVVSAIVGMAGLLPTLSAIRSGKTILLANKESLITCGSLFMKELTSSKAKIIPIDTEHNAIFQLLPLKIQENLGVSALKTHGIKNIILTGSGGPFYKFSIPDLSHVTPNQACIHPNWSMGKKISVDSATMMNKGLEYAEARLLFNASHSEMTILIHPESIVHSMVQYCDGSVLAQLSIPDIKIAILYALSWPKRIHSKSDFLSFFKQKTLSFFEPDLIKFPCLKLAIDAFSEGQAAMTVLNAANEIAVQSFLDFKISFDKIFIVNIETLTSSCFSDPQCIEDILEIDRISRVLAMKKVSSLSF
ncbi:1-deoxy-D-xylulose-5-phosphate reductoisomerase [Buchnera aphidicola (Hyadaphis tataricae)]|uniref:1-deoxy-D-xylulose 5-phosphate reductoisomerase n=1 Tax=Buchnera aphidicola (Hyadaphis tataricae) TaxID=1241859 RepID=A0A4D6Y572_9GAMM|nr:1-deoxy-D-xylulose-5-phosphate reductoisomerase [Buchnera aphidicola]QCI21544.1 1-deoxy-D-xylulose-5-phosphate reductoisomerase [Buchnera aphidicola (Hyadaphis tataricae)]